MPFAELCATSNFSFLVGAAHPEEYAREAAALGLEAIAIADTNSVAGVVRAHQALKELAREGAAPVRESDNVGHADVVARAAALGRRRADNRDARQDTPEDRAALSAAARGEAPEGSGWRGAGPAMRPGHDGPEPAEDGPTKPGSTAFEERPIRSIPRLIPAARLVLEDAQELVALPTDRAAWGRLCRLLTLGKRRVRKGECRLTEADVLTDRKSVV